jgi:hypothetical protein
MQVTQMKYRLSEGSGECFYYIGALAAAAAAEVSCKCGTVQAARHFQPQHMDGFLACQQ